MKKKILMALSYVLVAVIAIGGTLAYLTSTDEDVNVMVMGDVEIEQIELQRTEDTKTLTKDEAELEEFKQNKKLLPAVYQDENAWQPNPSGDYDANKDAIKWSEAINSDKYIEGIPASSWNTMWDADKIANVQDKFVFVENTGESDVYFRTIFAFEDDGMAWDESYIHANINESGIYEWETVAEGVQIDGGVYDIIVATYVREDGVLIPDEVSRPSLLQVGMDKKADNAYVKQFGKTYEVLVFSQAVQTEGFKDINGDGNIADDALNDAFGKISADNHPWINDQIDLNEEIKLEAGENVTLLNVTQPLTVSGEGTITLVNADITATAANASALNITEGSPEVIISGISSLKGAQGGNGIYVAEGASLDLSGDAELTVIGNNGAEAKGSKIGGSGIGGEGDIYIHDLTSLTAEGYGQAGFGIGGASKNITIENTAITYVKGGYVQQEMIEDTKYGKTEPEGGAAIGSMTNGAVITLTDVTVDKAEGGSKAAAIGARYWTSVTVNITDSTIKNAIGGNASAGIGGSRIHSGDASDQDITINIKSSFITAEGGQFGAGIGSGYDTHCHTPDLAPMCTINITGVGNINAKGGKYAAGIGTGYHAGGLAGGIEKDVTVTAVSGEKVYKDTYTSAMDIGFGVLDPARDGLNNTCTFDNKGTIITVPAVTVN